MDAANAETDTVARRIVAAREAIGLSKNQLAKRLGIDRRQLQKWENGKVNPYPRNLYRIAKELKYPMEYFVGEDEPC